MSSKVVEVMTGVVRPTVNFSPSIWGDHFLKYATWDNGYEKENKIYDQLKESAREKLSSSYLTSMEKLNFIDVIQRLGLSYHFNTEIGQILQCISIDIQDTNQDYNNDNLYDCALRFRLLRQQGYNVSSVDTFKKFLDCKGEFKISIKDDIKGMLNLHDATHLRFRGEDILEKAFNFTTKQFETMLLCDRDLIDQINPHLAQQITHSLQQSFLRGFIKIDARNYFSFYENWDAYDKKLLKFAKLDFNILQRMYQRELAELTRWWKNLNFTNKCPFARDRLVECYFFSVVLYFEPEYAYGREVLTKLTTFISVLDDIYDAYGTWEELVIFTDAINRWEKNNLDELSEYIRYFNNALHDYIEVLYNECVERKIVYGVQYLKQMVKVMANAYMEEARWLHNRYTPMLEEYMSVASITSCTGFLIIASFIGMNHLLATKEAFNWAFEDPPIMKVVSLIIRLADDIADFKFDREKKYLVSSVQCYMNQHDVSEDKAIFELRKQVIDAWKDINFELIQPTKVHKALLDRIIGYAIFMKLYEEVDGYTHPHSKSKDFIDLFVNPVDV